MSYILSLIVIVVAAMIFPVRSAWASETHILAFGDSLTAGYGLAPSESFAAQLEKSLRDSGRMVRVTNAGLSGDTTGGGLARLDWSLQDRPHLVILELGANDGLRGLDPKRMQANLAAMITKIQAAGARVILAGMRSPVNWGQAYQQEFDAAFPALAHQFNLPLYPFFLEGVITDPSLLLNDGLHPNALGVARIVEGILPLVMAELDQLSSPTAG